MTAVSFVAPVYNVEKYLRASVKSMLGQTLKDIEVILVDDGSTDGSGKICDELAAADPRVKVIHQENQGAGYARNAGIEAAKGKYIHFCDPDDLVKPTLAEDNFKLAEEFGADFVLFGYEFLTEREGGFKLEESFVPAISGAYDYEGFWENFEEERKASVTLWCRLFKRSFIEENNLRLKKYSLGEDSLFIYDVYSKPFKSVVYNDKIYYSYIRRKSGAMSVYKPERLERAFECAKRLSEVVGSVECVRGKYDRLLRRGFVYSASGGFRYLSAVSFKEGKKIIEEYMERAEVKEAFSDFDVRSAEGGKRRLRLLLIKKGYYGAYLALLHIYKFLGKK